MDSNYFEKVRDFVGLLLGLVFGTLAPIKASIIALLIGFAFNFFMGWKADVETGNSFSLKKAQSAFKLFLFWGMSVLVLYTIISLFDSTQLAFVAMKYLTWIVSYWYLVNVLKNAKIIFPTSKGVEFVYSIVTVDILVILMNKFYGHSGGTHTFKREDHNLLKKLEDERNRKKDEGNEKQ